MQNYTLSVCGIKAKLGVGDKSFSNSSAKATVSSVLHTISKEDSFTMKPVIIFFIIITAGCIQGSIPRFSFPTIEDTNYDHICGNQNVTLNFSGLRLSKIKENFISSPIINCLDLSNNDVDSIDFNAFSNLPNLRYLNMSANNFDLNDIFSNSHLNLETLILDRLTRCKDYKTQINFNIIYPKLERLFIRYNCRNIFFYSTLKTAFPSLTHLYLTGTGGWDSFRWLPNSLQYLDLSGHNLHKLTLQNLDNLQYLIVSEPINDKLRFISLNNLKKLKYLSAFSNNLENVMYSTFASLNSLEFLDISDNNIKFVQHGSLDHMKNLQFLNLSNNYIEKIQGGTFDYLENLDTLILEKNLISEYPRISKEIKLRILFLNCNRLQNVAGGTFSEMPHLESLYLHDNEISSIGPDAFSGLSNLKTLTLSNNMLSSLPFDWMLPMISIQALDLEGNIFDDFANLQLSESSPLENLYLSSQLKVIRSKSLDNIPENVTIFVDSEFEFTEKCTKNAEKYSQRLG